MTYGIEKSLYRMLNTLLLALIMILGAGRYVGLANCTWFHVILSVFVIGLLVCFFFVRLKGKLIMAMSVLGSILAGVMMHGWTRSIDFVVTYIKWLFGTADILVEQQKHIETLQVILISVIAFLIQLLVERFLKLKISLSVALLICMLADMLFRRELSHLVVVLAIGFVVLTYVEWVERGWKKQKSKQQRVYPLWVMPFLVLYVLLMLAMPAPDKPYDWKVAKRLYANLQESFRVIGQNWQRGEQEDFDFAQSGFSDSGILLGALGESNQEVMRIQGQKSLKTNVYLVGKTYDTFTGQEWLQTNEDTKDDRVLDALETMYAVYTYDLEQEDHYLHTTKLHIRYQYFDTKYLFTPLKAWRVVGDGTDYQTVGGNLVLDKTCGYGLEYDVNYTQINVDHSLFYEFLEDTYEPNEAMWKRIRKDYGNGESKLYTLEDVAKHQERMKQYYGGKVELSTELKAYIAEITNHAATTIQKLKAIEAELASYEYTLTPGALPKDILSEKDFLDYFMLESQKGYCSYFATAFVLLARAEGIPARYVEGFCVPVDGTKETVVYSSMAHAWPEVYIEGVGWIPFEPTPGYERIRYTPWEVKEHIKKTPTIMLEDIEEDIEESVVIIEEDEADTVEELTVEKEEANPIGYIILIVIAMIVIGMVLDFYLANRRYQKLSIEARFELEIQKSLRLLAVLGYQREDAETLEELQQRAWALTQEDETQNNLWFVRIYEDVLYGNRPVDQDMLAIVCDEKQWLLEQVKRWKKSVYWYYKYFRRY